MVQKKVDALVTVDAFYIRILINGVLHLKIKKNEVISIQSWIQDYPMFCIEYQTKDTMILSEYWDRDLWVEILKQLDEKDVI